MFSVTRYHDISCGHRVVGHEGKCKLFHGHNYRIHFTCETDFDPDRRTELDLVGRVVDFSVIKDRLCQWLEVNWDHRFLMWKEDPYVKENDSGIGIVQVPFNPTAENMARYLVDVVGPCLLPKGCRLVKVTVDETTKCSASYEVER